MNIERLAKDALAVWMGYGLGEDDVLMVLSGKLRQDLAEVFGAGPLDERGHALRDWFQDEASEVPAPAPDSLMDMGAMLVLIAANPAAIRGAARGDMVVEAVADTFLGLLMKEGNPDEKVVH